LPDDVWRDTLMGPVQRREQLCRATRTPKPIAYGRESPTSRQGSILPAGTHKAINAPQSEVGHREAYKNGDTPIATVHACFVRR